MRKQMNRATIHAYEILISRLVGGELHVDTIINETLEFIKQHNAPTFNQEHFLDNIVSRILSSTDLNIPRDSEYLQEALEAREAKVLDWNKANARLRGETPEENPIPSDVEGHPVK